MLEQILFGEKESMKLRESFSTLALALADLAQSLRVYVKHVTQQPVPRPVDPSAPSKPVTLSVIDDEELWKKEQESNLRQLTLATRAELEAAELERERLESAAAAVPKHERLNVVEASEEAKAGSEPTGQFEQW